MRLRSRMDRLILVSNRLPVTVSVDAHDSVCVTRSVGGLATGLRHPHEQRNGVWIGWPGTTDQQLPASKRERLERQLAEHGTMPVYLSAREVSRYYEGFANGVLWPLFHYLIGEVPLRMPGWDTYQEVNERFADAVARQYREGDVIWVHDYQLLLVPEALRRRVPGARIGFFLHIPFPSSDVFAMLPQRERILRGLLGADLVGFHTARDALHFGLALERILGREVDGDTVLDGGRRVRIGVFPMGVDAADFERRARDAKVDEAARRARGDGTCALLVGVDRLDYTKGIPRRLLAFEELLTRHPELRGCVRLVQVVVPSRSNVDAYRRLRRDVDGLVGRINGAFGSAEWVPIHYLYRSVPEEELLALYRAADVMLVTPLRDGMNLVAKEFVACRGDEDGVLVLSEFAGAAAEMREAVIVNPYDVDALAAAIHRALTMPDAERRRRMRGLRQHVFDHDVHRWADSFLDALGARDGAAVA